MPGSGPPVGDDGAPLQASLPQAGDNGPDEIGIHVVLLQVDDDVVAIRWIDLQDLLDLRSGLVHLSQLRVRHCQDHMVMDDARKIRLLDLIERLLIPPIEVESERRHDAIEAGLTGVPRECLLDMRKSTLPVASQAKAPAEIG